MTPCLGVAIASTANKNAISTPLKTSPRWTVISEIPVSVDAYGLLDAASSAQLMVLKNLYMQFRPSGLRMMVTLKLKSPSLGESVENVIRDLGMSEIKTSGSSGHDTFTRPRTQPVAPDGSIAGEWQDFVGPAEIGLAVRSTLGEPVYSQMESEAQ
jgi:hypothetical protein